MSEISFLVFYDEESSPIDFEDERTIFELKDLLNNFEIKLNFKNITLKKNKIMDKERKAIIKNSDMTEDMQQDAINVATKAIDSYNIEKDIACYIKKEFDRKHNPTWHCVVGRNFGSYVTHETKHFIYFYLGQIAVLLFKSG